MEEIIQLIKNPHTSINTSYLVASTIGTGYALGTIFLFFNFGWGVVKKVAIEGLKDKKFWDREDIGRAIVSFIAIGVLPVVIVGIENMGIIIAGFFEMTGSEMSQSMGKITEKVFSVIDDQGTINFFAFELNHLVINSLSIMLIYLSLIFSFLIRFIMLIFVQIFMKYLIIIAPLAAAFSILPNFRDQISKLLSISFNVGFVLLTFNILDHMFFSGMLENLINNANSPSLFTNTLVIVTANLTMIVMYLLAIWLTSQFVGSPAASTMLQMGATVATITTMAAMKMMGATMGAGAGAAKVAATVGNIGDTTKTIADDIKE